MFWRQSDCGVLQDGERAYDRFKEWKSVRRLDGDGLAALPHAEADCTVAACVSNEAGADRGCGWGSHDGPRAERPQGAGGLAWLLLVHGLRLLYSNHSRVKPGIRIKCYWKCGIGKPIG